MSEQLSNNPSANNMRIAKNTLFLTIRLMVGMVVSLFTAKYTLQLLGLSDYGINNVVTGLIQFTGVITASMGHATQRYLSVDLGKNDINRFHLTFSMLLNIYIAICILCFLIMELVGPLYIHYIMVLPSDRIIAAQVVFQFSIINFILDTINIPYTASLIATEKMGVYAYMSILDIVLRFVIVLVLFITPYDKLITLGSLGVGVCFLRNIILKIYCKRKIKGCNYTKYWDKNYFKNMSSYIGWSMLGSTNSVMMGLGQAILLNSFFGPVINAAKAIGDKITSTVYSFINNFYTAVTPQITKTYARRDYEYTKSLVINSTLFAFYVLQVLSIPILINIEPLLKLWLGENQVTKEMVIFSELSLLFCWVQVLECPITRVVQASGNVKKYEICVGFLTLIFIPICFVVFLYGFDAYYSMITLIIVYSLAHVYRIYHLSRLINIGILEYFSRVVFRILLVSSLAFFISLAIKFSERDLLHVFLSVFNAIVVNILIVGTIGLPKSIKVTICRYVSKMFNKAS